MKNIPNRKLRFKPIISMSAFMNCDFSQICNRFFTK